MKKQKLLLEDDKEQLTFRYKNLEDFLPHAELEILNLPNIVTTHSFASIEGPAYITPNGELINIESYLILSENDKYITHDDCVETIFKDLDTNKILKNPLRGDVEKDGGEIEDLIAFLEVRVGFIVCNRGGLEIDDRFYIRFLVNATRPTSMQYTRAIQFLDSSDEKPVEISLSHGYYNPVMQGFVFTPNKDIPEDAIKRVKRWYTTGKLVEDVDVVGDTAEFDNIQTTDEPVELKDIDTDLSTLIYPDDFKANGKMSTFINAIYLDMGSLNPYHEYYDAVDKCKNLIIVDGTTIIGDNAFIGLGMEELVIPNSVTTVGDEILMHCKHIKSIFIPNSVVIVTDGAFTLYNCNPDCTIFCEAPERPDGWSFRWNYNRIDTHRVIWGCSKEEYERIKNNPPAPEINPRNLTFDYVSNDGRLVIDNDNQNIRFDNGDDVQVVAGHINEDINTKNPITVIAFHGSQADDIQLSDKPLYATDDKLLAIDFAKGYCFNYDLSDKDRPTLYKVQLTMNNPRYIHTELEYDELMDIANSNAVLELTKHGFDGIIYEGEKFTYYLVFNAKTQAKVIEKQEVKCNSKRLYSKEEEYTKNYIDNDDKLLYNNSKDKEKDSMKKNLKMNENLNLKAKVENLSSVEVGGYKLPDPDKFVDLVTEEYEELYDKLSK